MHVTHTDVNALETHDEIDNHGFDVSKDRPAIKAMFAGVEIDIELPRFDMEYEDVENIDEEIVQTHTYEYSEETTTSPMKKDLEKLALDNGWIMPETPFE